MAQPLWPATGLSPEIIANIRAGRSAQLGPHPAHAECRNCNKIVRTEIEYRIGAYCWRISTILFLIGLVTLFIPWFFVWVPYCMKRLKNVEHYCPSCHAWIGIYIRRPKSKQPTPLSGTLYTIPPTTIN